MAGSGASSTLASESKENMTPGKMKEIVDWSAEAGRQEALLAAHEKRAPHLTGHMGLWQAFQDKFPKNTFFGGTYDLAVNLYSQVYAASVKECTKAIKGEW